MMLHEGGDEDAHEKDEFRIQSNEEGGGVEQTTPPKINMEPKNHPLEKEHHLLSFHYYVPC